MKHKKKRKEFAQFLDALHDIAVDLFIQLQEQAHPEPCCRKAEEPKPEIAYEDKSYDAKRQILRRYVHTNGDAHRLVRQVATAVSLHLNSLPFDLDAKDLLVKFLTDGYVVYERIFDANQEHVIELRELDPITLTATTEVGGKKDMYWLQYADCPERKRILTQHQIVYLTYANGGSFVEHNSLAEQIYMDVVTPYYPEMVQLMTTYLIDLFNRDYIKQLTWQPCDIKPNC